VTGRCKHRFTKRKLCLANLIVFYDEVTGLVDEGKTEMMFVLTLARILTLSPITSLRQTDEVWPR